MAEQFDLPFHCFVVTPETKKAQEERELELLASHAIDLVVLARYMQIITSDFIDQYPSRILNIHHSFLPAFVGSRPYRQAYDRGVKLRWHLEDRVLVYGNKTVVFE